MRRYISIIIVLILLCVPMVALAEGEEIPIPEVTPEATPTPDDTPEIPFMTETTLDVETSPTPSPTPYLYAYDTNTIIGGLATFMGIQQAEDTPQNLGDAIPYVLRIAVTVGVLWFLYAMIRGFTGNIFGKSRTGVR